MRKTLAGTTLVTLKNVHVATSTTTLGLEAALTIHSNGVECKVQVENGGCLQMLIVDI